jgi:ribonuclease HI
MIKMWFDGAFDAHTGNMGLGIIIENDGHNIYNKSLAIRKRVFGKETSNNVAEYLALLNGLNFLIERKLEKSGIVVYGDSQLVIKQMNKDWGIKEGVYKPYAKEAYQLTWKFRNLKFIWLPREQNSAADALSNIVWSI